MTKTLTQKTNRHGMSDDNNILYKPGQYDFDPSYGYSLKQLLAIQAPPEPNGFNEFWRKKYQHAIAVPPQPVIHDRNDERGPWRIFDLSYSSTDQFPIHGWMLMPKNGKIKRGFIIGHGYGGRDEPDLHLPFDDAVLFFPCFRGLSLSKKEPISSDPFWHVRHDIDKNDQYIIGGCVEDLWLAVSAMLRLFPQLAGHLAYLGVSFGGGIGALALPWDSRISKCHFSVPSFGHNPLRLKLKTLGSADSVQKVYDAHAQKIKQTLLFHDAVTAAKRLSIPVHCACAKFDPVVAPPGQFAVYNAINCEKQLYVLEAGHYDYPNKSAQDRQLLQELAEFFKDL